MSQSALKENLRGMLAEAKSRRVPVLLISVPQVFLHQSAERGWEYLAFAPTPLYAELAAEYETLLEVGILQHIFNTPGLKADALHPNAEGYRRMAETVQDALKIGGAL